MFFVIWIFVYFYDKFGRVCFFHSTGFYFDYAVNRFLTHSIYKFKLSCTWKLNCNFFKILKIRSVNFYFNILSLFFQNQQWRNCWSNYKKSIIHSNILNYIWITLKSIFMIKIFRFLRLNWRKIGYNFFIIKNFLVSEEFLFNYCRVIVIIIRRMRKNYYHFILR